MLTSCSAENGCHPAGVSVCQHVTCLQIKEEVGIVFHLLSHVSLHTFVAEGGKEGKTVLSPVK